MEDEAIVARDLDQTLTSLGYQVNGTATSGSEALELASLLATDLILMDIRIRGDIDGIATAEQVRTRFDIPVVFLTAHADGETLRRANKTEPYGYVVKPFNPSDVSAAVEVALNRHRLTTKLKHQEIWVHTVLNTMRDAIIAVDFEGNIRFMNLAAQELTGWKAEECDGKAFDPKFELSPVRLDAARSPATLLTRTGERISVEVVSSEIAIERGSMYQGRVLVISRT